jgi:hypothetical protein
MKRIIIYILLQQLAFFTLGLGLNNKKAEIYIAIKPSDCISCTAPIQEILNEFRKNQLLDKVTFVIKDVPEKALHKYTSEVLRIPKDIKVIASEELFSLYSYKYASAISIIDKTTHPHQRISFPLSYYFYNKLIFSNLITSGFNILSSVEKSELGLILGAVRMLTLVNDTLLLVNDRIFNSIQAISTNNVNFSTTLKLDSTWYYAPFSNDIKKIEEIRGSQFVLDKVSYPKYHFKGIYYNKDLITALATCYYPIPFGKDYNIFPTKIIFTLDSTLKITNYYRLRADNYININNAFLLEGNKLLTTSYKYENNHFKFNNDFLCSFKISADSVVHDNTIVVDTPNFAKTNNNLAGLLLNHISGHGNNKLVWFNYYPEFYDISEEKWVRLDTLYFPNDLTQNTFNVNEPIKFKVICAWKVENHYKLVVQVGKDNYHILQSGNQIYYNSKIYTLKEYSELHLDRNSKNELVGIVHNRKTGETKLVKFKLAEIKTFQLGL